MPLSLWLDDTLSLLYPRLCLLCNHQMPKTTELVCPTCHFNLPKTDHHTLKENEFTERFWGRIPLEYGAARYRFNTASQTQKLMHGMKYGDGRALCQYLGRMYGNVLEEAPTFQGIHGIIPVPLHPKKLHIRGYNQSEEIAKGLGEVLGIPLWFDVLERVAMTESQTRKSRSERVNNVGAAFRVKKGEKAKGKHVLLVDDVLTTGATLEACALALINAVPEIKISMMTLAIAGD